MIAGSKEKDEDIEHILAGVKCGRDLRPSLIQHTVEP